MTDTFHWSATYERACELFGSRPNAEQEQTALDEFRERPRFVSDQIEQLGSQVKNGRVRSGWAVLRKILSAAEPADIAVTDSAERQKRVEGAKRWIRNAGLYLDQIEAVDAALFEDGYGDYGQSLRDYAHDAALHSELLSLWLELRPVGEKIEVEAERRMVEIAAKRVEIQALLS